ncbi:20671_t:CDS:2 [Racocetra persica]|uniref:20671_t:CDS:1 n=1 Tax=Racocetra persica TaxID=160502 RepID=A0ACA9LIB1_9GLOM|nr:20671_t:CDS:2 [Racocetra persica]
MIQDERVDRFQILFFTKTQNASFIKILYKFRGNLSDEELNRLGQTLTQEVVAVHVVAHRAPYHVLEAVPTLTLPEVALVLIAGVSRALYPTHVAVLVLHTLVEDEIFGTFGRIRSVEMALDEKWQMNKGMAFIDFDTRAEAERAISYMDGGQLDGAVLTCTFVPRRPPTPPPPRRRAATVLAEGPRYDAIQDHDLDPLYVVDVPILIVILTALGADLDHHTREVVAEAIL